MDSPFYRSHWGSSPRYPPNFRGVPIGNSNSQTTPFPSHKPKVVSIPVHFVQPDDNSSKPNRNPNSRSDYAIRIQKLFRGFRVKKNIKKLLEIQRELREVETAILDSNTVEAIKRDERERLKVSERLMSLLFRLDSIGGFDCAVKDLRKTLIRRAIVLQEKVDSIAVVEDEDEKSIEEPPESNCHNQPSDPQDEELQSDSESCGTSPCLMEGEETNQQEEEEEEPVEKEVIVVKEEKSNAMDESKRSREMLERMVEENNKLMKLMADLFDKNEKQTRILSSLSERVGQLENAFACEKLRRRAKKQKKTKNSQLP